MEKSNKNSHLRNSRRSNLLSLRTRKAVASAAAFVFVASSLGASLARAQKPTPKPANKPSTTSSEKAAASTSGSGGRLENHQDLIAKAQNLTLQRDRLQASQVLIRALQPLQKDKSSAAYKELVTALDELTTVFYTEKAQSHFATAESLMETRPREALDQLQEALQKEERNVTVLKTIARIHLRAVDCSRADTAVKQAEEVNPYSAEIKLLRLQTLACQKNFELLGTKLEAQTQDLESVEKFTKSLQIQEQMHEKDLKKARATLTSWESQQPDYPEVQFWKWELSRQTPTPDRTAALKYVQLCQNLTPRKRKSFSLDVELCKGKEQVDAYLREVQLQSSEASGEDAR